MIRFLFLNVSSPFKLGVYEDEKLVKIYEKEGKASDVLPVLVAEATSEFEPCEIYYTHGPGNHMSLKIAYVCFKTLAITKNISLFGLNPFDFNGNSPIAAMAGSFFVHEEGKITLTKTQSGNAPFVLPSIADFEALKQDEEPVFLLPAV